MWQNAHPCSLAIWTGAGDSAQRHVFDLTITVDELQERPDFEELCYEIEHNLGVLDALGTGQGDDAYYGYGSDVEEDEVEVLLARFEGFLSERGLLITRRSPRSARA